LASSIALDRQQGSGTAPRKMKRPCAGRKKNTNMAAGLQDCRHLPAANFLCFTHPEERSDGWAFSALHRCALFVANPPMFNGLTIGRWIRAEFAR
jgi:hypothetical protein